MKYTIRKARHYAKFTINRLWPFTSKCVEGKFKFSKQCWYQRKEVEHTGWNKLTGISGLRIHRNSGRLVWQPDFYETGKILIAAYIYDKGVRITDQFVSVNTGEEVDYLIIARKGLWSFGVGDHTKSFPGRIPFIKLKTFPYFGERSKAPNTMTIHVTRKKC